MEAARRSNAGARAHSERTHAAAADAAAPAPPEPRRRRCACAARARKTRGLSPLKTHTRHRTTTHTRDTPRTRTTAAAGTAEDARHQHPPAHSRTHLPARNSASGCMRPATTRAAPRRTFPHRRTTRPFTELRRSPRSSPRWPCGRLRAPKPRGSLNDQRSTHRKAANIQLEPAASVG